MTKEQDQDNARRARAREVGLFRYALISESLNEELSTKQRGRLVRAVAARTHLGPFGSPVRVSRATLDRWMCATRAPCCIPGAAGRDSKGGSWAEWLTWIRKVKGTRACQETGGRFQT
jgi:hypothetical protein